MPLNLRPTLLPFLHPHPLPIIHRLSHPTPTTATTTFLRHASHAEQGRANGPRQGPGKRLGCKKSSQQLVVPGNIIFRQRGTLWYPGENVGMGRDHTIYAKEKGYVVFYRDPEQLSLGVGPAGYGGADGVVKGKKKVREKRRYIGVVMNRGDTLPRAKGAKRERRLGLVARGMSTFAGSSSSSTTGESIGNEVISDQLPTINEEEGGPVLREQPKEARAKVPEMEELGIRPGYMFREANWQIGRAEDKSGKTVRVYQKGDRFLAWRKKKARLIKAAEKRTLRGRGGKKTGGR
ncbi:MAG: hypothetical protein L6R42_003321 [Xanthoria sp. 1 TBL-2021]|nr:MAG: hypothetical protein L6R42_003321 [Xanthoria sp. 1 TBL-2021]